MAGGMVMRATGMQKASHVSPHKHFLDEWGARDDCSLLGLRSFKKGMKDMGDKARVEGVTI